MDQHEQDSAVEDRIDALGRRVGGELRQPAPSDGLTRVERGLAARRRNRAIAGAAVAVALVAGGTVYLTSRSDDVTTADTTPSTVIPEPAPTTPAPAPASTSATVTTAPVDPGAIATLRAYVGSSASTVAGDPIRIGLAEPVSARTGAAQSAVDLLNSEFGGIGGRPVELVPCSSSNDETDRRCIDRLGSDPSVIAIVHDYRNAVNYSPRADGGPPRVGGYRNAIDARWVSFVPTYYQHFQATAHLLSSLVPPDSKIIVVGVTDMRGIVETLLPTATVVSLVDVRFSGSTLADAIVAADATDARAVLAWGEPAPCTAVEEALEELDLDVPVVSLTCASRIEGSYYVDVPMNPDSPSEASGAAAIDALLHRDDRFKPAVLDWSTTQFADVLTVAKIANSIGIEAALDHARMTEALMDFQGPALLTGAADCTPDPPSAVGDCAVTANVLQVVDGKFVSLDPIPVT